MLPTPHGPTDQPLAQGAGVPPVADGRTPDEGALARVVEHLADDSEDDDPADAAAAPPTEAGAGPQAQRTDEVPDEHTDAPVADEQTDAPVTDEHDEPSTDGTGAVHDEPAADEHVGPVAAALSDTRHTIDELNAPERVFLAQQRLLIGELCPDPLDAAAVGALFDRVRAQWAQAPVQDRPDPRTLADALGVALGDLVCERATDLGWAVCSDRYGTEIVLAREDPEVLVYPIAAVAQSWESAAEGWFVEHLQNVVRGVAPSLSSADA